MTAPSLHILMLSQNVVHAGGTFARCMALARDLVARGHRVTLVAAGQEPRLRRVDQAASGVELVQMPGVTGWRFRHGGLDPLDLASRLRYVVRAPYDVVHAFDHRPTVALPARRCRDRRQIPLVTDWCDLWGADGLAAHRRWPERPLLGALDTRWEQRFHSSADALTVISSDLARRARALGVPPARIHLLPSGADVRAILPRPQAEARRQFGLPPDAPILAYSSFSPFGARLLAQTFVLLAAQNPRLMLLLVGRIPAVAHDMIEQGGYSSRVRSLGVLPPDRLPDALACGDVMLLPFPDTPVNRAGFPNKLGDYLAAGRPVVTNPTGDMGRLLAGQHCVRLVEPDPAALASAAQELLADSALREVLGREARRFAEQEFSWAIRAAELEQVYSAVCSG